MNEKVYKLIIYSDRLNHARDSFTILLDTQWISLLAPIFKFSKFRFSWIISLFRKQVSVTNWNYIQYSINFKTQNLRYFKILLYDRDRTEFSLLLTMWIANIGTACGSLLYNTLPSFLPVDRCHHFLLWGKV